MRPLSYLLLLWALLLSLPALPATAAPQRAQSFGLAPTEPETKPLPEPLLAAGNDKILWLLEPVSIEEGEPKPHGFRILRYTTGPKPEAAPAWRYLTTPAGGRLYVGTPLFVALVPSATGNESTGYVLLSDNLLRVYVRDPDQPWPRPGPSLPSSHVPVAGVGAANGVWVLARGPLGAATAPAATSASPLTTAPTVAEAAETWHLDCFAGSVWQTYTSPGRVGEPATPSREARPVLVHESGPHGPGSRLWMFWVEPSDPQTLRVRWIKTQGRADWSPLAKFPLGEAPVRLWALTILQDAVAQVLVLWPRTELSGAVTLQGAQVQPDPAKPLRRLESMNIAAAGKNLDPRNVVAAAYDKAIAAITREGDTLHFRLFDTAGGPRGPAAPIVPQSGAGTGSQIFQNLALIVLLGVLALSLWQWRNRPMSGRLPKDTRFAPLATRCVAAALDLVIPLAVVIIVFKLYHPGQLLTKAKWWSENYFRPELWTENPEVLWFLGGYLAHVTLGELAFGRSIGKALLGLRVVAADGSQPTLMAILIRNLVRIPEILTGILLLYVLLNEHHQRLGDLLARTLVVGRPVPGASPPPTDAP